MNSKTAAKRNQPSSVLALEKVSWEPLGDRVYRELRSALMSARFTPGQQLTLRTTADTLGVSVMPVRAAFQRLVAERAVRQLSSGSVVIPAMSRARFDELVDLRKQIEGAATARAAKSIQSTELEALARIGDELTGAGKSEDGELYLDCNKAFKFAVYQASQSPVHCELIEMLWLQFGPFMHNYSKDVGAQAADDRHQEVLNALVERNARAARRAMEKDIAEGAKFLASVAKFAPDDPDA